MANRIGETTRAQLDSLTPEQRDLAERATAKSPDPLELAETLDLFKAIKVVASVDGLSREERGALEFSMIAAGLGRALQQHVLAFETEGLDVDDVAAVVTTGSRMAARLLSGATTIAAIDGLTPDEESTCRQLGVALGLGPDLIDILIAEARVTGQAMHEGHRALVDHLLILRKAIHALVGP